MRATTILLALVGLHLAHAAAGQGVNPTEQVRHTLELLYARIDLAANRKDAIGATAYCTRDFVAIGLGGTASSLPSQRENMQRIFRSMGPARFTSTLQKVYVQERTAWVIVNSHLTATVTDPITHQIRVSEASSIARDTWVRTRFGWRLSCNQSMSESTGRSPSPLSTHRTVDSRRHP